MDARSLDMYILCLLDLQYLQEPNVMDEGLHIEKRASLLMMNFSVNEVDFALDKLGMFIVSKIFLFW